MERLRELMAEVEARNVGGGREVTADPVTRNGRSPLWKAAVNGHAGAVEFLLENGGWL